MAKISNFSQAAASGREHYGNAMQSATERERNMTARLLHRGLAQRPARLADRADKMKLYGWLIGAWTMDATVHRDDGGTASRPGRDPFRLGARGPGHPGRLDPAGARTLSSMAPRCASTIPASTPGTSSGAIRCSSSTRRQIGRAHRARHRPARQERRRRSRALELHRNHARLVPLDRRTFAATTARPGSYRPSSCAPARVMTAIPNLRSRQ